jgi:hypothetical protein
VVAVTCHESDVVRTAVTVSAQPSNGPPSTDPDIVTPPRRRTVSTLPSSLASSISPRLARTTAPPLRITHPDGRTARLVSREYRRRGARSVWPPGLPTITRFSRRSSSVPSR